MLLQERLTFKDSLRKLFPDRSRENFFFNRTDMPKTSSDRLDFYLSSLDMSVLKKLVNYNDLLLTTTTYNNYIVNSIQNNQWNFGFFNCQ
jgi:hypothetical protein